MDFKHVDKKYRPIPFWSWNEKLDVDETKRQIGIMDDAGIGGYFMHARGGLATEYMSDEWFDNVRASIEEGDKRGMHTWAYDENGWPSGFGGGKVNGLGDEYRQKKLLCEDLTEENASAPCTLLVRDGKRYYYSVNEFYVDNLDPKVVKVFINEIYGEYYRRFGSGFDGFFTDEPQIIRDDGFPWSFILEDKFTERYGYSLVDNLDALFFAKPKSDEVRVDYWQLVTDLFSESFFKQIYDWCDEHGYGLTGHLVLEENMVSQIMSNGACMPHYEYFHIPGMDWLGRDVFDCLTPMQLSSASAQLGKKQILSETYAASGHSIPHDDLKRIYEWQMVHGVNLLCTHLEGYTLRGIRKRDYPPAMYYQQPWWPDMKVFFDRMSRIGMLLAEGEIRVDTLLIHPQTTAWILYTGKETDCPASEKIWEYNNSFLADIRAIEDKHIEYHLGDETLMRRHAKVENGEMIIGNMRYKRILLPSKYIRFTPSTVALIDEFRRQGGCVLTPDMLEANPIMPVNALRYTSRHFDGYDVHYIVNVGDEEISTSVAVGNKVMIAESGELIDFSGEHTFTGCESLVIIDTHEQRVGVSADKAQNKLDLLGEWSVKHSTDNSITLDKCDYYFDGELIEKNGYVLNILPRINELERAVELVQEYRFEAHHLPERLYLATETPEMFRVYVNGEMADMSDCGYFRDFAFRKIDISKQVIKGTNVIRFESTVVQSPACYDHISKSWTFESMKNCLSYDMEIEPIYIVGDFGAGISDDVTYSDDNTYVISAPPVIDVAPTVVDAARLDMSGYCEFAGEITLVKEFDLDSTDYYCELLGENVNAVRLTVNGNHVTTNLYAPHRVDLNEHLVLGKNTIELTIVNNLRNMMGPHHLFREECRWVCPGIFYKESNIFEHLPGKTAACHDVLPHFNDNYLLGRFGLK